MSDAFEPEDGLIGRLRALGQVPVDRATQSAHLTAMAEAAAAPRLLSTLGSRLRVAAALVVGFLLGTTGLASAGALGPLQPIAATAIEAVTPLDIPHPDDAGTARFRGDGDQVCEDVEYKNRGSYLKAVREKYPDDAAKLQAAKDSDCGKPLASLDGDDDDPEASESEGKSKGRSADAKANKANKADDESEGSENGKADAACAGGAGNGVEAPEGAAVASGDVEPSESDATPTTGMPACAEEQKDNAGDSGDGAQPDDAGKPDDVGRPEGAGKPADAGEVSDTADEDDDDNGVTPDAPLSDSDGS